MRLFIAIQLEEQILDELVTAQNVLKKCGRCTPKENLHLTLKFLGEVNDPERIISALKEVNTCSFDLSILHLGSFETGYRGTIVWAAFAESKELLLLKNRIDAAIPSFKDDHPFKEHITIVRASAVNKQELQQDIKRVNIVPAKMKVTSFSLVKSELLSGGSKHTTLAHFALSER